MDLNLFLPSQPVTRVAEDEYLFLVQRMDRECLMKLSGNEQREHSVDFTSSQISDQRIVGTLDHRERQPGPLIGQTFDCARQDARQGRGDSDSGMPDDTIPKRVELIDCMLSISKDELRVALEQGAVDGGRDAAGAAAQKWPPRGCSRIAPAQTPMGRHLQALRGASGGV